MCGVSAVIPPFVYPVLCGGAALSGLIFGEKEWAVWCLMGGGLAMFFVLSAIDGIILEFERDEGDNP